MEGGGEVSLFFPQSSALHLLVSWPFCSSCVSSAPSQVPTLFPPSLSVIIGGRVYSVRICRVQHHLCALHVCTQGHGGFWTWRRRRKLKFEKSHDLVLPAAGDRRNPLCHHSLKYRGRPTSYFRTHTHTLCCFCRLASMSQLLLLATSSRSWFNNNNKKKRRKWFWVKVYIKKREEAKKWNSQLRLAPLFLDWISGLIWTKPITTLFSFIGHGTDGAQRFTVPIGITPPPLPAYSQVDTTTKILLVLVTLSCVAGLTGWVQPIYFSIRCGQEFTSETEREIRDGMKNLRWRKRKLESTTNKDHLDDADGEIITGFLVGNVKKWRGNHVSVSRVMRGSSRRLGECFTAS